jgi:hypothetical protein
MRRSRVADQRRAELWVAISFRVLSLCRVSGTSVTNKIADATMRQKFP